MSLKHFTNEFNTPYAQKADKTEAQLGKNIQPSATESSYLTPSSAPTHAPVQSCM